MTKHQYPKKPAEKSLDWHRADIKSALEKAGWSIRKLSLHHGVKHGGFAQALVRRYPRAERLMAEAIGVHPMVIWPSRYHQDGTPNSRRGNPNWVNGYKRGYQHPRTNRSTATTAGHVNSRGED